MAGRNLRNSTPARKERAPARRKAATSVLQRLRADEAAAVLKILLERHQTLRSEAEEIATDLVSSPAVHEVGEGVFAAVTFIDIDEVTARAGRTSWGYVDPADAATELLEEAIEDFISDMKRRMQLGLEDAAEAICRGVVVGLYMARESESDGALGWAPDFPAEEACNVVEELLRACPVAKRTGTRDRLLGLLAQDVPDWREMLEQVANRAMSEK
jgi:hypothetical protein